MSETVLTFVPNLELMQKDRTATLAWTLEVGEEERGEELRVGGAHNAAVGVGADLDGEAALDVVKVGDDAVVHEGVAAEDEGVVVDLGDGGAARGGADVGEHARRGGVRADRVQDGVRRGLPEDLVRDRAGPVALAE